MDRARLKTFVLLLLLVVNLTFLSLIIIDRFQAARLLQDAEAELIQVLEGLGISVEMPAIPDTREQLIYLLRRDIEAERQVANAVFEAPEARDEGGGLHYYFSGEDMALFRGGSFRFQFAEQAPALEGDLQAIGQRLLNKLDLTAEGPVQAGNAETAQLTYTLTIDGLRIVNGQVTFLFSRGNLQEIAGPALWGARQGYTAGAQLDAATALIRLAGHLRESAVASRFVAAEMGYYLFEAPGHLELRPVWIIETEAGSFSIDRQSGEIRQGGK